MANVDFTKMDAPTPANSKGERVRETNNSPMFRNSHMDALLNNCIEELNQDF
jgi:hypothetical protein